MSDSPLTTAQQQDTYREGIENGTRSFAEVAARIGSVMLGSEFVPDAVKFSEGGFEGQERFYISILFTGTVYGEYLFAISREDAGNLLGLTAAELSDPAKRRQVFESFSELLNIAVGESIVSLGEIYKKLTVTAPRSYYGFLTYPKVKAGHCTLRSPKGSIECSLYVDRMALDITASYKEAIQSLTVAHQELQAAMTALQGQQSLLVQTEKLAALGVMAAGVAHEINSPLATVSLLGEQLKDMVQEDPVDRAALLKELDRIEGTIGRISRVTNSMREFAHGVSRSTPTRRTVRSLVEDLLMFCEHEIAKRSIDVKTDLSAAGTAALDCQAPKVIQALLSLINNAADAVEELPLPRWIEIAGRDAGDAVEFAVTDSGRGIPMAIREKIFDPFFTMKAVGKGSGLGLSLARTIVVDHGGSLVIDETCPHTRFVVRIPKKSPAAAKGAA